MTKIHTIMPCDPSNITDIVSDLIGEDESTFSPREAARAEKAAEYGETYYLTITRTGAGTVFGDTDLGSPESLVHVSLPGYLTNRQVALAMAHLCRHLVE